MANPIVTFNPVSGYTVPIYPAYNDQTFLLTASTDTRYSYKLLSDIVINGTKVDTLKSYPFNGTLEVNPQNITSNYLAHNFNPTASPILDNPDSVKAVNFVFGEEYSRKIAFSSVTSDSGNARLNLTTPTSLSINDRILITLDNIPNAVTSYNTYANIIATGSTYVTTDLPYVSTSYSQTGILIEGCEYYDYSYAGFQTLNPHKFSVGDTVFLQMDSWATATFDAISGIGDINQITVGGVNLLSVPVTYNTTLASTMGILALDVMVNQPTSGIYAFWQTNSNRLHIYSNRFQGDSYVGLPITITTTGSLVMTHSPSMYKVKGIDTTGEGWNPHLSGQYTVATVPSPTTFTTVEPVVEYYNNETGSERGSWYSLNNYVFTGLSTSSSFYVMNNKNFYDYASYENEIQKHTFSPQFSTSYPKGLFLTDKPRTSFNYYSTNDIETVDLLWEVNWTGEGTYNLGNQQGFYVRTYTGTSTSYTSHFVDISHYTSGFTGSLTWKRFSFGVGAFNINNIPSQYITPAPAGNLITDDVYRYEIVGNNGNFLPAYTELLQFNRKCTGNAFKYYQLIFLNKWGAFDYVALNANYETDLSIERTQYDSKRESVISPFNYGTGLANRGKTDFYINSTKTIKLYSDWLTLPETNWLKQVFESPQVYLYCPVDNTSGLDITNLYPVNITDSDVKLFNERSRMRQFEFNLMVSNTRINQKN